MLRKIVSFIVIGLILFSFVDATNAKFQKKDIENVHILYIYTNNPGDENSSVREIELLLTHFTEYIVMKSDDEVTEEDINKATDIIYYGGAKKELAADFINWLDDFEKTIFSIGENVEQFKSYTHVNRQGNIRVNHIQVVGEEKGVSLKSPIEIKRIQELDSIDVKLYGTQGNELYPLLTHRNKHYYFATKQLNDTFLSYIAEFLHDIIPNDHEEVHEAHLQLEGIHPKSDPEKVRRIGEQLNERDIPYQLVVMPVYTDPDSGTITRLSDAPELVEVLQELQSTNGSIVAHGYTNGIFSSETSRGAEFWDIEHNQFIFEDETGKIAEKIKDQGEFPNEQLYEEYLVPLKEFEATYIRNRLDSSITELVKHDLYPLAFKVPNNLISDEGYQIVSEYFSSMFGQVQVSHIDGVQIGNAPYITTASYLHGMTLYPDTIGAVDTTAINPIKTMEKQVEHSLIVRDGMIGGSYHVYLDDSYLDEMLVLYERINNIAWLDLKKTDQFVTTEYIQIKSHSDGNITVQNELTWWNKLFGTNQLTVLEKVLWMVTILVGFFVVLFLLFTIRLRLQLKKRLFEERKHYG